jgi:N-methylhydantoinase A
VTVARPLRVGVDVGGTFTDLVVRDDRDGATWLGKTLTTHDDPAFGIERVITETFAAHSLDLAEVGDVVHGTTLVTNALIERRGAVTALLTTAGFRDVLEIRREARYELYDLRIANPVPLVPRQRCTDVPQRTLADGTRATPLDEDAVRGIVRRLVTDPPDGVPIEAVAVSYLHSYVDPSDERRTAALIAEEAPHLRVSLSSDVAPEIREFERATTTVANVYVQRLVEQYLASLVERLRRSGITAPIHVMMSSGGIATVATASRLPIRMLESGPAGGALAAARFARDAGLDRLLSFDMGGTTAKLCVVSGGQPLVTNEFEVDRVYRFKKGSGMPVRTPVIEMIEIGAGGGSIAHVDSLGLLGVGPESAGSEPGPACYGRGGTRPTVTDADVLLGLIDPASFLGGAMHLDVDAARTAMFAEVAEPLGIDVVDAAWGVHALVTEHMANAARVAAIERGVDPAALPVFAYGGAGPVHACRVAAALGATSVVVPAGAGVLSAGGFLEAPFAFDAVRTGRVDLSDADWSAVSASFASMRDETTALLVEAGADRASIVHRRSADARYVGQGFDLRIDLPDGDLDASSRPVIEQCFAEAYISRYGRLGPQVPIELVALRLESSVFRSTGEVRTVATTVPSAGTVDRACVDRARVDRERAVYWPEADGFVDTPVHRRDAQPPGACGSGPAIIEERESTLVVPPGATWRVRDDLALEVSW